MKTKIYTEVEVEVFSIGITIPVRRGPVDISVDFPMRDKDQWSAVIEVETGRIQHWPKGRCGGLNVAVYDFGCYVLFGKQCEVIWSYQGHSPHKVIPGSESRIDLNINTEGIVTNWPKNPRFDRFFEPERSR